MEKKGSCFIPYDVMAHMEQLERENRRLHRTIRWQSLFFSLAGLVGIFLALYFGK